MTWVELIDKHSEEIYFLTFAAILAIATMFGTWARNRPGRK